MNKRGQPAASGNADDWGLVMEFSGEESPVLDLIKFRPRVDAEWVEMHGIGPKRSFRWDVFPKAFALFFLGYVLASKRGDRSPFIFEGKPTKSAAATLGNGIDQTTTAFHKLFQRGLRSVFGGTYYRTGGKLKRDRQICLQNEKLLPADCIKIVWKHVGPNPLTDETHLLQLVERIENQTPWRKSTFATAMRVPPAGQPQLQSAAPGSMAVPMAYEKPPDNLLGLPPVFLGRDELRKQTIQWLSQPDLLVLWETGGMGKTTFANQVAHDAVNDKMFPGGAVWVDCKAHPNFNFPSCINKVAAVLLRKSDEDRLSAAEKVEKLAEYFSQKRTLVILDNYEIVIDDQQMYAWLWTYRASASFLLTTNRVKDGLRDVAKFVPLHKLDSDAAIALFKHHAKRSSPSDEELGIIRQLCDTVGYSPLAIFMLGCHAQPGGMSLQELKRQFDLDMAKVLEADGPPLREWHSSMDACFEFSTGTASEADKSLLLFLSIPPGGVHKDLAKRYVETFEGSGLQPGQLLSCVNQGLVWEEGDRYTLHPLWRAFLHRKIGAGITEWEEPFVVFMVKEAERQIRTRPEHQQDFEAALWVSLQKKSLWKSQGKEWEPFSKLCRRLRQLPAAVHYVGCAPSDTEEFDDYFIFFLEDLLKGYISENRFCSLDEPQDRLCILLAIARELSSSFLVRCDYPCWADRAEECNPDGGSALDYWKQVLELSHQVKDKEAELEALHAMAHWHLYNLESPQAESELRQILALYDWNGKVESAPIESVLIHLVDALQRQGQANRDEVAEKLEVLRLGWENRMLLPWPEDQWFGFWDSSSRTRAAAGLFLWCANILIALRKWEEAKKWLEWTFQRGRKLHEVCLDVIKSGKKVQEDDIVGAGRLMLESVVSYATLLRAQGRNREASEHYRHLIARGQMVSAYSGLVMLVEVFSDAAEVAAADNNLKAAVKLGRQGLAVGAMIVEKEIQKSRNGSDEKGHEEESLTVRIKHLAAQAKRLFREIHQQTRAKTKKLQRILDGEEDALSPERIAGASGPLADSIRASIRKWSEELGKDNKRNQRGRKRPPT